MDGSDRPSTDSALDLPVGSSSPEGLWGPEDRMIPPLVSKRSGTASAAGEVICVRPNQIRPRLTWPILLSAGPIFVLYKFGPVQPGWALCGPEAYPQFVFTIMTATAFLWTGRARVGRFAEKPDRVIKWAGLGPGDT